jgi:outer membrane protein TolC
MLVLARVLTKIQSQNVRLTEDNLDLAKLRVNVGYSGRDEVFRWETQLATNRSSLIDQFMESEQRRIDLNNVLGVNQGLRWQPVEIDVDPDTFYFLAGRLDAVYDDPAEWTKFREYMITYAHGNSPEIKFLSKLSEAQGIQVGQRKRRWFLPVFALDFTYNYEVDRSPDLMEGIDQDSYWLGVTATYPVFNGAERYYSVKREQAVLQGIDRQMQNQRNLVERRTRTSLRRIESSFPIIRFQRIAADNARQNLRLVQDKYAQGLVDVTELLDAQNSAFTADQSAAASVYAFLIDLVEFQRSISFFEDEKTQEERDALENQINEALRAQ